MTEENWSGAAGMAYMNSHFSMASDDTESTAAHELGHMLGAVHNFSISWWAWAIPIMGQPNIRQHENQIYSLHLPLYSLCGVQYHPDHLQRNLTPIAIY
jgi:hypothetical protein